MNKSVLIIEDEPLIAQDIFYCLKDIGINNVKISLKYESAIKEIGECNYDLILLDINLSGEQDGIDIANFIINTNPTPFIFITSYYDKQTISRAKQTNPAAYILKPFNKQDIQVNVEMVLHKASCNKLNKPEKIFIKEKKELISINPAEIDYVEAYDNYAIVHIKGKSHIISHTLKSIEEKLSDSGFERIHKSFLINFSRISMISGGNVFFEEKEIPIGRAYKSEFMAKISAL